MNKKLLPFKGRVTSKSLIDLLGYIDSGSTYDSDESEADKAKNSPTVMLSSMFQKRIKVRFLAF